MEKLSLKNKYSRLKVARKIRQQLAIPACRVLLTRRGCRASIAAIPPTKAYTAYTNASTSAKEPNKSTETSTLPRQFQELYMVLGWDDFAAGPPVPPGAASSFEAHLACTRSATTRTSHVERP